MSALGGKRTFAEICIDVGSADKVRIRCSRANDRFIHFEAA
jgi:hypothetical protein